MCFLSLFFVGDGGGAGWSLLAHNCLDSVEAEHHTKRIKVDVEVADFNEFKEFYKLLTPVRGRRVVICEANVDHMLRLSEYYHASAVKYECETVLGYWVLFFFCISLMIVDRCIFVVNRR